MANIQSLNRILNNARVHLPGVLDNAMKYEFFNVLDEFLKTTGLWKEEVTFAVTTTKVEYVLVPTAGTIVRLIGVQNSDEIKVNATMETPPYVVFDIEPQEVDTYTAKVVLTVTDPIKNDGFPVIPEWILIKYLDELTDGLKARMMAQPKKPYSDERMGIYNLRRFRNAMAIAASDADHMHLQGGQSWAFPRWA